MSTQTTITFNVPVKLKKDAQKVLKKTGMDLSSALRMFLDDLRKEKYEVGLRPKLTENGFTPEVEKEILKSLREYEDEKRQGVEHEGYVNIDDYIANLRKQLNEN